MRRLARRLVGDEHVAEDLAQDVQLAALASRQQVPVSVRAHRAWLARVVRNLSINWRRGQNRRVEHERASARDALVDPAQVRSRIELQQRMLALVAKLADPYRTTIYLRFYEQLKPQQIAEKQQVSVHTVKTRIQRGLKHLRDAMDREAGPRSNWRAVLVLPLSDPNLIGSATGAAVLGGVALNSKLLVAVAALLLAAISFGWFAFREHPQPEAPREGPGQAAGLQVPRSPAQESRALTTGAKRVAIQEEVRDPTREADWIVSGRVSDAEGTPIAGAKMSAYVRPSPTRVEAVTDAQGRYKASLVIPGGVSHWAELSIHVSAVARNYRAGIRNLHGLRAASSKEHNLTVDFQLDRGASVRGRLLAADSTPEVPVVATRTEVALVDESGQKRASTRVDGEGRFAFPLPETSRIWVVAGKGRFGSLVKGPLEVVAGEDLELGDLLLDSPSALQGQVTHPDGRPVPGLPIHARIVGAHTTNGVPLDRWHDDAEATTSIPPRIAGATSGSSRTDGHGHFSFLGLAPGTYELYVNSMDPESKDGPYKKSAGRFQTGAFASVTLGVYRVQLTVVDTDGFAVPSAQVAVSRRGAGGAQSLSSGLAALCRFDVEPGEYVASASVDGARQATTSLVVETGIYSYEIKLVLDFAPVTGEVDLVVTDDAGTRLRAYKVNLWNKDEDTLAPVITGKKPDSDGVLRGIPVGRYRMRIRFAMEDGPSAGESRMAALGDHFPTDAFAIVEAGKRTEVRAQTKAGGRLLLSIATSPDRAGSIPVSIEIDDGRGGVRRLLYLNTQSGDGPSPSLDLGRPRTGAQGYTDLIRPGTYTLRAKAKGYPDFETQVRIVGSEPTRAHVLLRSH